MNAEQRERLAAASLHLARGFRELLEVLNELDRNDLDAMVEKEREDRIEKAVEDRYDRPEKAVRR